MARLDIFLRAKFAPHWAQMAPGRVIPSDANFEQIPVLPRVHALVSPLLFVCTILLVFRSDHFFLQVFSKRYTQVVLLTG